MKPQVQFYPLSTSFKNPAGAVRVNQETRFRLLFSRPSNPEDVFLCLTKDGENEVRYPLNYIGTDNEDFHEYEGGVTVTSRGLYRYHFLIETKSDHIHVGRDENLRAMLGKGAQWQLTVFDEPHPCPDWLKGGVIYQILPDRFNIGGERLRTKGNIIYRDDWDGMPYYKPTNEGKILNNDMFGGNIKGITKKLSYLNSLGVNCIYLNPVFEAHSNHKYDTGNYRKIDPDFGTADDLKELIKKAAKKGMRVILDGVFSHTGDDSIYFNKYGAYDSVGAFQSADSPYYDWYRFSDVEKKIYDSWWGIDILPNTVEENVHFNEFINGEEGVIRTWTGTGIGGWRLDVADELPDVFLDNLTAAAKKINPDALIIGEVWEDASNKIAYSKTRRYLQGGQLDSVTNYPLKNALIAFVRMGDSQFLYRTVTNIQNNYPKHVIDNLMNILGTHDTVRILTEMDGALKIHESKEVRAHAVIENPVRAVKLLKMASALQYTLPGVPCVYYGDEAGMYGYADPFNRRCYPWDKEKRNNEILSWYKKLGKIRKEQKEIFSEGEFIPLEYENGLFIFERRKGKQKIIIAVNNSGNDYILKEEYAGFTDLLTGKEVKKTLADKSCAILTVAGANS